MWLRIFPRINSHVGGCDCHVGIMEEFDLLKLALVSICMLILLGGFEFTVVQRNLKEWHDWEKLMFASAKGKQEK